MPTKAEQGAEQGADMTPETQKTQINGIDNDPALRALLAKRMGAALTQLAVRPLRAEAVFVDDNGPKGGPALRCALTVRLPRRPNIRVERSAETPRLAFDAALVILKRQLERYRERDRQDKRHPKKYFAAARAQATGRSRSARRARGA
jgi:ribosome-associated translation inhibitor RaiA